MAPAEWSVDLEAVRLLIQPLLADLLTVYKDRLALMPANWTI